MATWLRTGSASFTNGSKTVTFTGVNLLTANIRVGDALHGPDNRVYEIDSVDSATQATLVNNYGGATASAQDYAIQPTRGITAALYDQVQVLVSSVQSYVSGVLSGIFPAGSASSPSISGSGDTNTGFFWPGGDVIGIAAGGTERARATSTFFRVNVPLTGTAVVQDQKLKTAELVVRTGDFGIGAGASLFNGNIDSNTISTGTHWVGSGATGTKPPGQNVGMLRVVARDTDERVWQEWFKDQESSIYRRYWLVDTWSDWHMVYDTGCILGTVSESSGVPTGAIIEQGSNANGEYVRFADGTQICTNGNAAITTNPAAFTGTVTSLDSDKMRIGRWF
jgi:hypothetical protein